MNIPNDSNFFDELDVLGIKSDDGYAEEMRDDTKVAEVKVDDDFNLDDALGDVEQMDGQMMEPQPTYRYTYHRQAVAYVRMLNVGNKAVLPKIYRKKLFTKDERDRLKLIEADEKAGVAFLSETDIRLKSRLADLEMLIEAIPFSTDEQQELSDALEDVLKMTNAPQSPVFTLVVALITIEGMRLLPLMNK